MKVNAKPVNVLTVLILCISQGRQIQIINRWVYASFTFQVISIHTNLSKHGMVLVSFLMTSISLCFHLKRPPSTNIEAKEKYKIFFAWRQVVSNITTNFLIYASQFCILRAFRIRMLKCQFECSKTTYWFEYMKYSQLAHSTDKVIF